MESYKILRPEKYSWFSFSRSLFFCQEGTYHDFDIGGGVEGV